jgi:hypothetical protein
MKLLKQKAFGVALSLVALSFSPSDAFFLTNATIPPTSNYFNMVGENPIFVIAGHAQQSLTIAIWEKKAYKPEYRDQVKKNANSYLAYRKEYQYWYKLAGAQYYSSDFISHLSDALDSLNRSLELAPKNLDQKAFLYMDQAELFLLLDKPSEALSAYDRAQVEYAKSSMASQPFPELEVGRALAKIRLNDAGGALNAMEQAILSNSKCLKENPRFSEGQLYEMRGDLRQKKGNLEGALADYTEATKKGPKNPSAFLKKARLEIAPKKG